MVRRETDENFVALTQFVLEQSENLTPANVEYGRIESRFLGSPVFFVANDFTLCAQDWNRLGTADHIGDLQVFSHDEFGGTLSDKF